MGFLSAFPLPGACAVLPPSGGDAPFEASYSFGTTALVQSCPIGLFAAGASSHFSFVYPSVFRSKVRAGGGYCGAVWVVALRKGFHPV